MIQLLRRLVRRIRETPPLTQDTLDAQRRLRVVESDDAKIAEAVRRQREIIRENHLGPMIAALFERRPHR